MKSRMAFGGLEGRPSGFWGSGKIAMPFLSFLRIFFFSLRRLCTGTFSLLHSARYSCHVSFVMNSLQSSFHLASLSLRWTSQVYLVWRSALAHSCLYFTISSMRSFLLLAAGAPSASAAALRLSATKTAKGDFGGCCGASERKRSVTTFIASFMNSMLIFFSLFLKPRNFWLVLKASMSSIHLILSSFSFSKSWAFSSSEAVKYFCISAERPLPSPLPGSTSFL
mmetsp:Transcript_106384/g.296006  ORF Transcript_106384/g.296006 Transcript_106384/m.296006 type:complete len:224 (+) Transcript_106384:1817-2488(+)